MDKSKLQSSIDRFMVWYKKNGPETYDRMDFWSSPSGILAKKLFYHNKLIGAPLALLGLLLENFFPSLQKKFSKPHSEVIGDAHLSLGFLNLYVASQNKDYLDEAEKLLKKMSRYSSKGYSGICWGYSFGWQHSKNKFWPAKTPMTTITPYAFWAFKKHYEITKCASSKETVLSIAEFVLNDLNVTKINDNESLSYSPISNDIVINANSYSAAVLYDAYSLTKNIQFKTKADKAIEFILNNQGSLGEWYYEAKPQKDNFIDNFHTCFVLRNLYYCYQTTKEKKILDSIKKGYTFYKKNLFYKNKRPKHFAVSKYIKMRKYEMYDYAEGIKLGVLLDSEINGAVDKAIFLAHDLIDNFQVKEGYFVTRVTSLNTYHRVPYMRWPQAQLFYSLTMLKNHL